MCQNESLVTGRCKEFKIYNLNVSEFFETGKCQNHIKPEIIRIWMCQNRKVWELLNSWMCQSLKVSNFNIKCLLRMTKGWMAAKNNDSFLTLSEWKCQNHNFGQFCLLKMTKEWQQKNNDSFSIILSPITDRSDKESLNFSYPSLVILSRHLILKWL